jgi:hypothetical protein
MSARAKRIHRNGNFMIYNSLLKSWWWHGEGWSKSRDCASLYDAEEKKKARLPKNGHWVRDRSWSLV